MSIPVARRRPTDAYVGETAERAVAGVAVISNEGATWARDRLTALDFHDPRCWRLVDTGAQVDGIFGEQRTRYLANVCELEPAFVTELENGAPVMFDWSGSYAAEVREAAEHRHRAMALVEQLEELTGRPVAVGEVTR
jgi:hypothetical protein